MVTQRQVFEAIRRLVDQNGSDYARTKVDWFQKRLYALDLEGDIYFYAQDREGVPVERAHTIVDGLKSYSTLMIRNRLDVTAWESVKKPAGWAWSSWPPRRRNDLLGCRSVYEHCLQCEDRVGCDGKFSDDDYASWVNQKLDFWHKNISIRLHGHTGFGLHARNHIQRGTIMGEYTGIVVPMQEDDDDYNKDSYCMQISYGPRFPGEPDGQIYRCLIDSAEKGSVFRFMNHSCEPNAEMREMRCGQHNRINVVVATRSIGPGEQITISYSDEWSDNDKYCYCNTRTCRNPPKKKQEINRAGRQQSAREPPPVRGRRRLVRGRRPH